MSPKYKVTPSLLDSFLALKTEEWMSVERFKEQLAAPWRDNEHTIRGKWLHHVAQTGRIEHVDGIANVAGPGGTYTLKKGDVVAEVDAGHVKAALELYKAWSPEFLFVEKPVSGILDTPAGPVLCRGRVDVVTLSMRILDFKFGARPVDYTTKMQWRAYCEVSGAVGFTYLHALPTGQILTTSLTYTDTDREMLAQFVGHCVQWMDAAGLGKYVKP